MKPSALMERAWSLRFTDPVAATGWAAQGALDPAQAGHARVVQGFLHWRAGRLDHRLPIERLRLPRHTGG